MKYALLIVLAALVGCEIQAKYEPVAETQHVSTWPADARYAAVSGNGQVVAISSNTDLIVYDKGQEVSRFDIRMKNPNAKLSFDGRRLAARSLQKDAIVLLSTQDKKELATIEHAYRDYAFSPDGRWFLVDMGKNLLVHSVQTGDWNTELFADNGTPIASFHFATNDPANETTINLVDTDGHVVQWQFSRDTQRWQQPTNPITFAAEDQGFDPWVTGK